MISSVLFSSQWGYMNKRVGGRLTIVWGNKFELIMLYYEAMKREGEVTELITMCLIQKW